MDLSTVGNLLEGLGVFLAALGGVAGYWFRIRTEQKRALRRTLYYLLELRYKLRSLVEGAQISSNDVITDFTGTLGRQGFPLKSEDIPDELKNILDRELTGLLEHQTAVSQSFEVSFFQALDVLAETDPITAYKLYGSQALKTMIGIIESANTEMLERLNVTNPTLKVFTLELQKITKQTAIEMEMADFDVLVRMVAVKCRLQSDIGWILGQNRADILSCRQARIEKFISVVMERFLEFLSKKGVDTRSIRSEIK